MHRTRNVVIVFLMLVALAVANTQGPNNANLANITGVAWSNPQNAATTDAAYATVVITGTFDVGSDLCHSNFGFSIPAGATINGITVAYVVHASAISSLDFEIGVGSGVAITKVAGTRAGTAKSDVTKWGTTDSTITFGSGADLWGTTWTPTDINSSGFGVCADVANVNAANRTAFIDSALITITFTPAPGCKACFMPFLTGRKQTQTRSLAIGM